MFALFTTYTLHRLSKVLAYAAGALERTRKKKDWKRPHPSRVHLSRSTKTNNKANWQLPRRLPRHLRWQNALHNTNSVTKSVCSIHSRLRSVYIYLGLFLPNHTHLWTYTRERRPPLVPEVTHCGQSFTYFGLRISYRSVRTVSK